jgi:hypothetical protein
LRLLEVAEVRRRLILSYGHQFAVGAQKILLRANRDMIVTLPAIVFGPEGILLAIVNAVHDPRPGQRIVGAPPVAVHAAPTSTTTLIAFWSMFLSPLTAMSATHITTRVTMTPARAHRTGKSK